MPKSPQQTNKTDADDGLTQSERFIKAAQELGTDDDPERFKDRVRKVAKAVIDPSNRNNSKKPGTDD